MSPWIGKCTVFPGIYFEPVSPVIAVVEPRDGGGRVVVRVWTSSLVRLHYLSSVRNLVRGLPGTMVMSGPRGQF